MPSMSCRALNVNASAGGDRQGDRKNATNSIRRKLLGGELPTNRKWVSSPQLQVDSPYLSHVNHWGYKPLTIRGMSHQVWI